MKSICFNFHINLPYQLITDYNFFCIGNNHIYINDQFSEKTCKEIAEKYIDALKVILELIKMQKGKFKISFSITGTAIEQFKAFSPEIIETLKKIADTGCVEFCGTTYYNSFAFLVSEKEFLYQVNKHKKTIEELFGTKLKTFQNGELIYGNSISDMVAKAGYKNILTDNFSGTYHISNSGTPLLSKSGTLSAKFAAISSTSSTDLEKYYNSIIKTFCDSDIINIFTDFSLFEKCDNKISVFSQLVESLCKEKNINITLPSEAITQHKTKSLLNVPDYFPIPCNSNSMQQAALLLLYKHTEKILSDKLSVDEKHLETWRCLQNADYFYNMSTEECINSDYFATPHDAFITYANILNDLFLLLKL